MIRLRDTKYQHTGAFLEDAIRTAEYYGFIPVEDALKEHRGVARAASPKTDATITFARREERPLSQIAKRISPLSRPVLQPLPSEPNAVPAAPEAKFLWRLVPSTSGIASVTLELHVVGTSSTVAEALLLLVANAIAEEAGIAGRSLLINSIGSTESSNRYVRDVGTYLRKHIDTISPSLRPRAAQDPLGTLVQLIERGHPGIMRAPQATEYLIEDERRRFWELLEYLEASGLSYELSPHVLGSRDCWSHALYEISTRDDETGARIPFAFGGRYDPLATRFNDRFTPAATISIACEMRGKDTFKRDRFGLPAVSFIHLGLDARRKSLGVLEMLRHADIPVYHSLTADKIGPQMARAAQLAAPYLIIMGYKEAMEGTVMVREVSTNAQDTLPVDELPTYLKRRRIGAWKAPVAA